ncbi:hypothetical protein KL953_32820, partial [Mycolicibacterium goodii]|uniref:hypothetical protein n=1 Tax=Mycolicibacterium goodii TaxID=134601 RepID=UPI001BDCC10E
LLCSSDFGRSLEESRDDLQSLGYDTPVPLIRSDSYTTLLDATLMDSRCWAEWFIVGVVW